MKRNQRPRPQARPQSASTSVHPAAAVASPHCLYTASGACVGASSEPETAWQAVSPVAAALPSDAIVHPRVTAREGFLLGLKLAQRVEGDATERAPLEALVAAGFLDGRYLHRVGAYASAGVYVCARLDRAGSSQVTVAPAVLTAAEAVKGRMMKVLGFYFDADTDVGKELATIRAGSGHADLAGDLLALAPLYRAHRGRIEKTPEFYVADDEADAARLGKEIVAALATKGDGRDAWSDALYRVWTLFAAAYDEVIAAGRYAARARPDAEARYPRLTSLNAEARSEAARAKKPEEKKPEKPEEKKPDA